MMSGCGDRCDRLRLEWSHDRLGLVIHPNDQNLRHSGAIVAHRMADLGADVLQLARLQGRLRAVLLFEHESAFKTIDELVPTGMHVPLQALAGRKINNEHQRLLARHALQIGLKYLLGGGRIRCRYLRPSRGSDQRPACQKAAGNHKNSEEAAKAAADEVYEETYKEVYDETFKEVY